MSSRALTNKPAVTDRPPPAALLRIINPALRALIGTPLGRVIKGIGVLRFTGRRTGRAYAIVAGVYEVDGAPVVFTPATWRLNFRGGVPAELRCGGRTLRATAELVDDPERVAAALQHVLDQGTKARQLGLRAPGGHRITPDDVVATGRALVRFTPND